MFDMLGWLIGVMILLGIVIPALVVWLVIKYVFRLRALQEEQFLYELGHVVHDAVLDALKDNESAKRYTKTTQTNYTPKK